jgi:acyl-CoA synthetase (AMP-forming)/AMP-acid ligase II
MLLGQLLRSSRRASPDKVALWFHERRWTYAEFDDATDRMAAALAAAGVRPGDRVALFLPNCPELWLSYFACFKLGAINVPLNFRYRAPEVRHALEHSGSTALMVHQTLLSEVASLPLVDLGIKCCWLVAAPSCPAPFAPFDDLLAPSETPVPRPAFDETHPAAILYTSGSTARPKGVVYTHSTLSRGCAIQTLSLVYRTDDVHLITTAGCHAAAFTGQFLPAIAGGATCVLTHMPKAEEIVHAMKTHAVTRTQMLPASLEDLVEYLEQHPTPLPSWRCCTAGGDVVPLDLHERFRRVAGFDVTELFGMTEALSCITNPPFGDKRLGSVGKPVAQTRARIVDLHDHDVPVGEMGELLIQTPEMMVGYWNDPAATADALRGGWLHTGDVARQDADGWFWFVGRRKEIIIRGGSNISPLEVEEAIDAHPAVHLSCVVGVPDKHYGAIVAAYVELRPDATEQPTAEELRTFVAGRIAAYKVPERMKIVEAMPLNPSGKVDRKTLHAWSQADFGEAPSSHPRTQ